MYPQSMFGTKIRKMSFYLLKIFIFIPITISLYCMGIMFLMISEGCLYKGSFHPTGMRWSDGCAYTCVCVDGKTGQYRCTPKYVHSVNKVNQSSIDRSVGRSMNE